MKIDDVEDIEILRDAVDNLADRISKLEAAVQAAPGGTGAPMLWERGDGPRATFIELCRRVGSVAVEVVPGKVQRRRDHTTHDYPPCTGEDCQGAPVEPLSAKMDELLTPLERELFDLRARLAAAERERDCGQDGVCAVSPGCARHWQERNRELVRERDYARQLATIEREENTRLKAELSALTSERDMWKTATSDASKAKDAAVDVERERCLWWAAKLDGPKRVFDAIRDGKPAPK